MPAAGAAQKTPVVHLAAIFTSANETHFSGIKTREERLKVLGDRSGQMSPSVKDFLTPSFGFFFLNVYYTLDKKMKIVLSIFCRTNLKEFLKTRLKMTYKIKSCFL